MADVATPDTAELEKHLQSLADDFKLLDTVVGQTTAQEREISGALRQVIQEINRTEKQLSDAFQKAAKEADELDKAMEKAAEAHRHALETGVKQTVKSGGANILGGAISGLLGPFASLAGAIGPLVGALNPSIMMAFNQVMRNLTATIGVALVPIIDVLKGTIQSLSITLFPAMKALAPIFANITNILTAALIPVIGIIVDIFLALAPALEFVTDLLSTMADVQRVIVTVWRTVIQTLLQSIASLFGGVDLKSIAAQFRDVLQTVTKYFVLFAAYLSKWIASLTGSGNNFIDNLLKNFGALQGKGTQAIAAPQGVGMKGFEQIGKDVALASFAAQGGGGEEDNKSERALLKDISEALKDVQTNNKNIEQFINGGIDRLIKWLSEKWGLSPEEAKGIVAGIKAVVKALTNPVKTFNEALETGDRNKERLTDAYARGGVGEAASLVWGDVSGLFD